MIQAEARILQSKHEFRYDLCVAPDDDFTILLERASGGDLGAQRSVWDRAYTELHRMARKLCDEGPRGPGPTTVLHEGFLKTFGTASPTTWDNRAHFFGSYARAMGQCLVDWHRSAGRRKRGGGQRPVGFSELGSDPVEIRPVDRFEDAISDLNALLAEAIEELSKDSPLTADVVRVRCLGGLSLEHASVVLGIKRRTVSKHWNLGRAQLRLLLASRMGEPPSDSGVGKRARDRGDGA